MNFHVVLLEPEIPNNTGNIGRTCVGTNCHLHLIEPLGFDISDKQLRRAGLDYWPNLKWNRYVNWQEWVKTCTDPKRVFYFSAKAKNSFYDVELKQGDTFVFGKESVGLPGELIKQIPEEQIVSLPIYGAVRSLNVATVAAIVIYEGLRQLVSQGIIPKNGVSK